MKRWWPVLAVLVLAAAGYAALDRSRYQSFEHASLALRFFRDGDPLAGAPYAELVKVTGIAGASELESWVCFDTTYVQGFRFAALASDPVPPPAPIWLGCYDADKVAVNLATGTAKAYVMQAFDDPSLVAVAAVYPDGHGIMWRERLTEPLVRSDAQP